MKEIQKVLLVLLIAILAKSQAQDVSCGVNEVEWHAHPSDCTLYLICFHGIVHTMRCAPGLHWSRETTECMLPEDANCILDGRCPPFDDPSNPIFLPNEEDCQRYYLCVNGIPNPRNCSDGLWWDVENNWCTFPDQVTCDNRTVITPPPPTTTTTTTLAPSTISTTTLPTTTNGPPPNIGACWINEDLFDGSEYIKSACYFNRAVNYNTARTTCGDNGMNLFMIQNGVENVLFHNATMRHVGTPHPRGSVIINGRVSETTPGSWNVHNADDTIRGPIYENLNWVSTETIDGRTNGPCLTYSGEQGGEYQGLGMPCTASRWFVCEHGFRTATPDPTQPTVSPTTPQLTTTTTESGDGPNIGACAQRDDLFNGGDYLKSLCIMTGQQNHANSQQICRNNGMQLFSIDSSATQIAFRTSVSQLLAAHPRGFVWINGRIDDECRNWFTFTPDRNLMWNGVHWVQTDTVIGRETGDCLRFTAAHSVGAANWQAQGMDCNAGSWFVCEFFT